MSGVVIAAAFILVVLALVGAYLDFRYRRLPNWLCLMVFCAGIGAGFVVHDATWAGLGLFHAFLALLIGMLLFAGGMIGGGDAKFYAAIAAWVPVMFGIQLFVAVSLAGLLVLLVWFPVRGRIARAMSHGSLAGEFKKVPYGIAISIGGAVTYIGISGFW